MQEQIVAQPTDSKARIEALDIIRGVAVLGILILNIPIMGAPFALYQNPNLWGDATSSDIWSWFIAFVFFEGSFRTVFGMLFGAGVYLFMSNLEKRFDKAKARNLHLKRSFWLIIFGLVDAYLLLWVGDILFIYGVIGLLLWIFRKTSTKALVLWIIVFMGISGILKLGNAWSTQENTMQLAKLAEKAATTELSPGEKKEMAERQEAVSFYQPPRASFDDEIRAVSSGWPGAFGAYLDFIVLFQTVFLLLFSLWDSLIAMLLGILLFRNGFLKGESKTSTYIAWGGVCYALALGYRFWMMTTIIESDFNQVLFGWLNLPYDFVRIGMAIGHISLIVLALRFGFMPLRQNFAAAGRMALTNYLGQSVAALIIFILFGAFGSFERIELYLIMAGIWAFQLFISPIWLKRHAQGPAEALWRTLTYGKG